jgi:hypothetical protein
VAIKRISIREGKAKKEKESREFGRVNVGLNLLSGSGLLGSCCTSDIETSVRSTEMLARH